MRRGRRRGGALFSLSLLSLSLSVFARAPLVPSYLAQVLLHKLGADHPDEAGGGVVGDRFRQHGFPGPGRAVEQDAARRVDAHLGVQVARRQGQLHRLPDLLLLDIVAADVGVRHVRPLRGGEQGDRGVGLGGQHVDERIGVPVQGDRRARLEHLPVQGGQDAHVIVGAGGGADDAGAGVHHLQELADDEGD